MQYSKRPVNRSKDYLVPVHYRQSRGYIVKTGTTERPRVINRLAHVGIFIWMKPSMTTCPVSVPVIVEFCPEASNATAKEH